MDQDHNHSSWSTVWGLCCFCNHWKRNTSLVVLIYRWLVLTCLLRPCLYYSFSEKNFYVLFCEYISHSSLLHTNQIVTVNYSTKTPKNSNINRSEESLYNWTTKIRQPLINSLTLYFQFFFNHMYYTNTNF